MFSFPFQEGDLGENNDDPASSYTSSVPSIHIAGTSCIRQTPIRNDVLQVPTVVTKVAVSSVITTTTSWLLHTTPLSPPVKSSLS
jgi:hypothetical protein